MKSPVLVLHRKSANRPEVKAAVKSVRNSGIDLKVRIPWNKKDKRTVVRKLLTEGYRRIIAGGGDGTLNAVAGAMLEKTKYLDQADMAILPLGTANDLAHGLNLPCDDLTRCLHVACTGQSRPMDIGVVNDRIFVNVASGGFGAEVTATTPQDLKKALGGTAYTLNGLIKLWGMEPYTGTLQIPGSEPLTGSMLLMAVGNNRLAGGGFEVAPRAIPDDGLLDLMMLGAGQALDPGQLLAEMKDPFNSGNTLIRYLQLDRFTIEANRPLHINLDGEPMLSEKLAFSVLPRALRIVY